MNFLGTSCKRGYPLKNDCGHDGQLADMEDNNIFKASCKLLVFNKIFNVMFDTSSYI